MLSSLVENLLFQKSPLQDFLSSLNAVISTNESTPIIMGHVIYSLAYTYKFQLKTTYDCLKLKILIRVNHDQLKGGLQYKGRWLCC